ncbi:Redoxin [Cristinia sonorae]|uniref:Putative peroxiredoxin n=1 Tax=Cristinia sonorae TaxID=1940300 RepID=A0A8K0UGA0_9AGAR|nr:Redoxin [Cristinia sonorae]
MSTAIKVGDTIPEATFWQIAYQPEESLAACGIPSKVNTSEWKGKKVVLVSVPGAFTGTCHVQHLPPYLQKVDELKAKGVDVVAVFAANDPFVMSAWSKVSGFKDKILSLSDPEGAFGKKLGWELDLTGRGIGLGVRSARGAIILDDLKVVYIEREPGTEVSVSGVDAILAAL